MKVKLILLMITAFLFVSSPVAAYLKSADCSWDWFRPMIEYAVWDDDLGYHVPMEKQGDKYYMSYGSHGARMGCRVGAGSEPYGS
jgi:hypothetical protein